MHICIHMSEAGTIRLVFKISCFECYYAIPWGLEFLQAYMSLDKCWFATDLPRIWIRRPKPCPRPRFPMRGATCTRSDHKSSDPRKLPSACVAKSD